MKRLMTRLIMAVVITVAVGMPATAQTVEENGNGRLWVAGNEAIMDSKIADAAKFRVGAPFEAGESGGGGAFSFDVIGGISGAGNGRRVEVVLFTGGLNSNGGGETGLFVTRRGTWGDISDAAQIRVYEATSDGIDFKVPVTFSAGTTGGGSGAGDRIGSGNFMLFQQGDGNVVSYEVVQAMWCPRWSIWTGPIPKTAWPTTGPAAVCRN